MAVEYIWVQSENGATMMSRQPAPDPKGLFGEEGITFKDVLDIINPLQQIPIIGSIYRELTGDTIKPGARLIGGGIYALGIGGIVSAALSNAIEHDTGKDPLGLAIALVSGEKLSDLQAAQAAKNGAQTQLAANTYYAGGADPIDPAWLPQGAKLVDHPVGGMPPMANQYAELTQSPERDGMAPWPVNVNPGKSPAAPTALAALPTATDAAPEAPAAATGTALAADSRPTTLPGSPSSVAVAPLPPTISPGTAAGDSSRTAELPNTLGLTGLTKGSHLPSAGSIVPPNAGIMAAAAKEAMTPTASSLPTAIAGSPKAASAVAEATTRGAAATTAEAAPTGPGKGADGFFALPARMNNVVPKNPVPQSWAQVGTQPNALSTAERRGVESIKASAKTTAPAAVAEAPTTDAGTTGTAANPQMVPAGQVPDAMMRALDKYDALMKSRRAGGATLDRNL